MSDKKETRTQRNKSTRGHEAVKQQVVLITEKHASQLHNNTLI